MRGLILALVLVVVASCGGGGGSSSPSTPPAPPPADTQPPPQPPAPPPPVVGPPPAPEPVFELDVVLDADSGDYWEPVRLSVSYTKDGEPIPYEYEVTEGRVVEVEGGLEIYSNGQLGHHTIVVEGEEFQYSFRDMPVCEGTREGLNVVDCVGLRQGGSSDWYIYYGEDDERIVEWEVVYVGRQKGEEYAMEADQRLTDEANAVIDWTNEQYARFGVFVRLKLVQIIGTPNPNGGWDPQKLPEGRLVPSDVLTISGALPGGICGYAGKNNRFRGKSGPLRPLFGCGGWSFIHELGHTVGLGHGENGGVNSGGGSTFYGFAQGGPFCGYRSDFMQYGGSANQKGLSNHKLTCAEVGFDYGDDMAGSLDTTSTAYAINRVRYDVSLINDEYRATRQ